MATSRRSRGADRGDSNPPANPPAAAAPRELVVITSSGIEARATPRGLESATGADVTAIAGALAAPDVVLRPLFDLPEERVRARVAEVAAAAEADVDIPDLARFYGVDAPEGRLDEIADQLREAPGIEAVYIKPPAELPQLNDMLPTPQDAPPATPDFTSQQGYLNPAPGGIDAKFAWTKPGGTGAGINIIDLEGAWRFTHEDLGVKQGGLIHGIHSTNIVWRNHGTAVIGEFSGDKNGIGITGICADAFVRGSSIFTTPTTSSSSAAIMAAANLLGKGDILLLELHRAGPRFNFQPRDDQRGYIAIEWWPDDLAAIKFAVAKGIIVVEAAGNGAENLDDPIYSVRPPGFPASWVNPFKRNPVDSGAIVVGAGAPPSGNFGADRSRLGFSNWGALVDAQGWGREVVTCAYGDLQGGTNENLWYTNSFSGTSSASPIVVGAIGCLQGMLKAAGKPVLTPAQVRSHLRSTGSPQQNGPNGPTTQRIGNRPDLKALYNKVFGVSKTVIKDIIDTKGGTKDFKEKAEIKETKEFEKGKDTKEIVKEVKDVKEGKEFEFPGTSAGASTEQRLAALEQTVQTLTHFIGTELRPDVASASLGGASDAQNLSAQLQKQATDAKGLKDAKDVEKTRDF